MSDVRKLFARLDFTHPGLHIARRLVGAGDDEKALQAIVEHFRNRQRPTYLFDETDIADFHDDQVMAEADQICDHHIFGYDLGEVIDWHYNATATTCRDPEWLWSLARHNFWVTLARAYAMTGDETYAREFVDQLKGFVASWPVEPHMGDVDPDMSFPGNAWRSIEAGIRIYTVWLPVMVYFRRSPMWDEEGWVCFLNAIHDHGEFLRTHYSNHRRCSNWLTMECSALFQLGVMFPEFKRAEEWQRLGYRRVTHEVRYQFDHYGAHMERTPVYHLVAAGAFLQAYRIAKLNGIPVPPYMFPILEKSAEFLMALVKPDLTLPMIGDADRDMLGVCKADTSLYEGMNLTTDPYDQNELRAFFRTMAELTEREDFRYLATCRQQGQRPMIEDISLPDAGFHVFRSGWREGDSYLLVTGTQLERGEKNAHSHFDAGHVELQIAGEDVLVDTGRYIYSNCAWQDWRAYFRSTRAHNTVAVDDHEMGTVPDTSSHIRCVRTFCHRFEPSSDVDLVEVSHNGYAFMSDPVFHLRRVIHFKPAVWLIDDVLTGVGEHEFRLYFNFAPGRLEKDDAAGAYVYTAKRVKVRIAPLLVTGGLDADVSVGQTAPKGGWVSYGYAERVPAPQLIYTKVAQVPVRFLTAIVQHDRGMIAVSDPGDETRVGLDVQSEDKAWSVTLELERFCIERWLLGLSLPPFAWAGGGAGVELGKLP